ncbi:unnamed protein product [Victoria cruziana]
MMHKYIGSDVTSMVTLPVIIFEPMTMLQKMAELMEYSSLLDQADECEDPYMRLVYASSWAISVYFAYQRTWKPFNPILGETYEMVNHGGITFLAEQVSHHPPMSAGHAENEHFTYDVTSKLKTKFLGNSLDVYPVGRTRVTLKRSGVILDLVPPPTKVNNLIFGRTWVDSPGEMIMTNLTTGDKTVLYFQPCGWFGYGYSYTSWKFVINPRSFPFPYWRPLCKVITLSCELLGQVHPTALCWQSLAHGQIVLSR